MTRRAWLRQRSSRFRSSSMSARRCRRRSSIPTRTECVHPAVEGQPVDLVYGRFDSPATANDLRGRVVSVGFTGTEVLGDGCGRWKVVLENVPSIVVASQVRAEAVKAGFAPTLELATGG